MTIEYNNGKESKLIKNVLHITVVDDFVVALLTNQKELTIATRNIESIIDNSIFGGVEENE